MSQALVELTGQVSNIGLATDVEQAGDRLEGATPQDALGWAFEQFGDRLVIATGFGAEGMALIDMAVRINPNANVFFIDTGFLFAETYDLRRRVEDRYGIEIKA